MKKIFILLAFIATFNLSITQINGASSSNTPTSNQDLNRQLFQAVADSNLNNVQVLINSGAQVNAYDEYNLTPLDWAVIVGCIDIARVLIYAGADVSAQDGGIPPLHFARIGGHTNIAQLLREELVRKLFQAVRNIDLNEVQRLINLGIQVDAEDVYGDTPLHWAAGYGLTEIAQALIEKGADLNAKNSNGTAPLHVAAMEGNADIAQLLINNGANIGIQNTVGNTPLHYAKFLGNADVAQLLEKADLVEILKNIRARIQVAGSSTIFNEEPGSAAEREKEGGSS